MSGRWATLNDRQRAYLRALYECDQATEAAWRDRAARGFYDRTPASEWRWVMYGPVAPPSALYTTLRRAGLVDPGTGATWQALEERGLCLCRHPRDIFGVQLLEVQITPLGRKAGLVDPGTGATWQALEERGLCLCRHPRDIFGVQLLEVQITPLGRKAVRAALSERGPSRRPKANSASANGLRWRGSTPPAARGCSQKQ